jgi:uncharacterized protein (DUF433 family)
MRSSIERRLALRGLKRSSVEIGVAPDWSQCPDAESIEGKMSGAWYLKGTRLRCEDITGQFDAGCSAEEIAGPDIYDLDLELVRRILAFAGRA